MRNKLLVIFIFIFVAIITCGAASAADTLNNTVNSGDNSISDLTPNQNALKNNTITNNTHTLQNNTIEQVSTTKNSSNPVSQITISGNVKQCSNDQPFSGVTITVKTLKGKILDQTYTDVDGDYLVTFHSNETAFDVSASRTGHGTVTETVNVDPQNSRGSANFTMAPDPEITISNPGDVFINEDFNFTISFNNAGNTTGFGPIVELTLPSKITFKNARFLTANGIQITAINLGVFPSSGVINNPYTHRPAYGDPGEHLWVLFYPLGSFTPDQPSATIYVNAHLAQNSSLGTPLNITAKPWFQFGNSPTGTVSIEGDPVSATVNPTVIKLTKKAILHEKETATGPNYPYTYQLILDIANGATVTHVDVTDIIPGNLQFIDVTSTAGGTVTHQPSTTTPGGNLTIHFNSVTGSTGQDRIITYQVYAPEFNNASQPVLNPNTGSSVTAKNNATATGTYLSQSVGSGPVYDTVYLHSLAIQKTVNNISSNSTKPGDTLEYKLNFQVSDFFAIKDIILTDTLGDGQTFDASFIPHLHLVVNGVTINLDFTGFYSVVHHPYTGTPNPAAGTTTITFYLSDLLEHYGYSGLIKGGLYDNRTINVGATTGNITFRSKIDVEYENPANFPSGNSKLVSGDPTNNQITINGKLDHNNHTVNESSSVGVEIERPTIEKTIYAINGNTSFDPEHGLGPGDTVTFSLYVIVPTTNLENFTLTDYLPIPFLVANEITGQYTGSGIPPAGTWMFASDDTLSKLYGILPTMFINSAENTITFFYGTFNNSNQPLSIAHILFTVTATNEPMADGLYLANLVQMKYSNSKEDFATDDSAVLLKTKEPHLNITKTPNPTTGDAGDNITYTITVKNTGHWNAYNITIKDILPPELTSPILVSIVDNLGNTLSYTGNLFTNGITLSQPLGGIADQINTIIITVRCTLSDSVYPCQVIENTAQITNFSSTDGGPNYVKVQSDYEAKAKVNVTAPTIDKEVTPNNQTIGENGTVNINVGLPEGTIKNLEVTDTLPLGINYTGNVQVTPGLGITLGNLTTTTGTLSNGRVWVKFLWDTVTIAPSAQTLLHTLNISFNTLVADNTTYNPRSPYNITKTNNVSLNWTNNTGSTINDSYSFNVVQPHLVINKTVNPTTANAGQTVTYTITVRNNGSSNAYNFKMEDVLTGNPARHLFFDLSSFQELATPTGYSMSYNPSTGVLTYWANNGVFIAPSDPLLQFRFALTLLDNAPSGSTFRNTANATYASLENGGRNYTDSDYADLNTVISAVNKSIIAHSEPATPNGSTALIGEVLTYWLNFTVPKGVTYNATVTDILRHTGYGDLQYIINSWTYSIPSGVTTSNNPPLFNYNPTTGILTFNFGNITNSNTGDATITITFKAVVMNTANNQGGTILRNQARLTYQDAAGNTINTPYSTVNTTVQVPVLNTSKVANPTTAQGGDTITFTVRVQNQNVTNSQTAYDLRVTDLINSNYHDLIVQTITPNGAGITVTNNSTGSLLSLFINKLAPGEYVDIVYTVKIIQNVIYNSTIQNTVTLTGTNLPGTHGTGNATPGDPGTETGERTGTGGVNDLSSSSTATVNTLAPTISKTVEEKKTVNQAIGDTATEKITIDLPEGTTSQLRVVDVLPAGLTASNFNYSYSTGVTAQYSTPQVIQSGNTYYFNFGNVTSSQPGQINITYTVLVKNVIGNQNGVNLTNNATLYYRNGNGTEINAGSDTANIKVIEPDLQITKTGDTNLKPGQTGNFTLNISHTGNSTADAYDLKITDLLPTGMTYKSGSAVLPAGWSVDTSSLPGAIIFKGTQLLLGATANITYQCVIISDPAIAGQNLTNQAILTYASAPPTHPDRRTGEDGPGGLNDYYTNDSWQVHVLGADLQVTKTGTSQVYAGQQVNYTVTVTNNGPDTAENVNLKDEFTSLWFERLSNPQYRVFDGSTWTGWTPILNNPWNILLGDITNGNSKIIEVMGTVLSSSPTGTITNTATANSTTPDPTPENKDTANTNVETRADLSITKTGTPNPVVAGKTLTYTITIHNNGPSDAQNVILTDDVTSFLNNPTFTTSLGSSGNWTGNLNLGVLASGDTITITITGKVKPSIIQTINNTAYVSSPTDPDAHPDNPKQDSWETNVTTTADLTVVKTGNPNQVVPGQTLTYTIKITNNGPSDAQDVALTDDIPSVILNPQYSLDGQTWHAWTGSLNSFTLGANKTVNILIRGTVSPEAMENFNNTAMVTSPTDPNNPKESTTETHLKTADVGVTKNASNLTPNYKDMVKFIIKVTNYGPDEATGVKVTDLLPAGLQFINATASQGSYNPVTGVWDVGSLSVPLDGLNSATLTIWTQVVKTGSIINNVTKTAQNEYDPNPDNNQDSKTLEVPPAADLKVTKTVNNSRPYVHDTIHFTIIVQNLGPDTATDVYVKDILPAGVTYVNSTANYGLYDPDTGILTIGNLPQNTTAQLLITCVVEKVGPLENTAHVYSSTYDPVIDNNSSTTGLNVISKPPAPNPTPVNGKTIGMQNTGIPLPLLVMAILAVLAGVLLPRRKK